MWKEINLLFEHYNLVTNFFYNYNKTLRIPNAEGNYYF